MNQRYYSNIYWHFTGSPKDIDWSRIYCPADIIKEGTVKESKDAIYILKKILESKVLLGRCSEKITNDLKTEEFCCVTDIPLKDLTSHALYYGKVAIGFKAKTIQKSFTPVLYIPKSNLPVVEKLVPNRQLTVMAYEAFNYSGSFQEQMGHKLLNQASANKEVIKVINEEKINNFFLNFIKITDFHTTPENTFYREREWRNIGDFKFEFDDVCAIVVPEDYVNEMQNYLAISLNCSNGISVLAWEFIENA